MAELTDEFPCQCGKYQLLARIGQGGMAEVFRARLPGVAGFEKIVVIKRLLPHLSRNKNAVEMFVHEAKLAAEVQHRNVVQVFELEQLESGEYYMAMEHVAGTDLRQLLRAAAINSMRIPPWFSVHALAEILDGLAFAHGLADENGRSRNVVHRDVTPANIFISYMGDIKLGDFGVAKDLNRSGNQTRTGQLKGKVPYMSPEQLYGRDLDQRTDVFAAGVVLWECLTQRRLFGGRPDIEAMNLICYGARKPPSHFANDVPPSLDSCVLRALESDMGRRTPSAYQLQQELLELLPQLRPRVLQGDVRDLVEVLLGNRDPSPTTGPRSIQDDSISKHNFVEHTPRPGSSSEGPPLWSTPPQAVRSPLGSSDLPYVTHASATSDLPSLESPPPRMPPPLDPMAGLPPGRHWPAPSVPSGYVVEVVPAGMPPTSNEAQTGSNELQITDGFPRELLAPVASSAVPPQAEARPPSGDLLRRAPSTPRGVDLPIDTLEAFTTYEGPNPFWVQRHDATVVGPVTYADALRVLQAESQTGFVDHVRISATGQKWMDAADFAMLTGQELLLDKHAEREKPLPKTSAIGGSFQASEPRVPGQHGSAVAVLARVAREKPTGKLIIISAHHGRFFRREIMLSEGRPTFVYTDAPELQMPELFVQKGIVARDQLASMLHWVVLEDRPLEEVVATRTGTDITRYWSTFMKERMVDLFKWASGKYALDANAPLTHTAPFSQSILSLVPELVYRAKSAEDLRYALARHMESRLERSERFNRGVAEMRLTDAQTQAVIPFGGGRTLASSLRHGVREDRVNLTMAYVLLEADLLLRPL